MRLRLPPAAALGSLALSGALAAGCPGVGRHPAPAAPAAGRAIDPPAAPGALAPNLALAGGVVVLSWLEPLAEGGHRLLVARLADGGWGTPVEVVRGDRFFANWADLPAVAEAGDGSLVVHWLAKTASPVYAYSIFLARSLDGGASWARLGRLNDDDTPTEHGFVSWVAEGDGLRAFWLDGRAMESGGPMALRTARVGAAVGAAELLDPRVCECCSTAAALTAAGPVVAYRDRGAAEVRDIAVVRRQEGGWSAPAPAKRDGWTIAGCPVNGPEIAAAGELVALTWFTAAGDAPRVELAFSDDGGASFGRPLVIDAEAPLGRVGLALDGAGGAVVSWLATADDGAAVRLRRALPGGALGEPFEVARTGAARASGFPRLVRLGETLYLAWVDTTAGDRSRLRARAIPLGELHRPS